MKGRKPFLSLDRVEEDRHAASGHAVALLLRRLLVLLLLLSVLTALPGRSIAQKKKAAKAKSVSFKQAFFYYNTDDISDKAASIFKKIAASNSKDAPKAQYYLGSYYHRKYYIYQDRWGKENPEALKLAEKVYDDYIRKYGRASTLWFLNVRFDESLVLLKQEPPQFEKALKRLKEMRDIASKDPQRTIYLYQIIWSRNLSDVIDYSVNARDLADFAMGLLSKYQTGQQYQTSQASVPFDQIVSQLKDWCQSVKAGANVKQHPFSKE